jgi:hypothetical protein
LKALLGKSKWFKERRYGVEKKEIDANPAANEKSSRSGGVVVRRCTAGTE